MIIHLRRLTILVVVGMLAAGCAATRKPILLSDLDAYTPIRLAVGDSLVITLPADREAGQAWNLAQTALEVLALDGDPTYMAEAGDGAGAAGAETWRFIARRRGRDELRFEYRDQAASDAPPARVLRYEILAR